MNLQSLTPQTAPLQRQSTLTRSPTSTPTPSVQPTTHQPSVSMQGKVQQSQGQSDTQAQLTSPQTLTDGQQQIQQQPPESLQGQHQSSAPVLQQTSLGQKLQQVAQTGGQIAKVSSQVHDVLETEVMGVKPMEQLGELMKSGGEPFSVGGFEIPTGESKLIEHMTGLSSESVKQAHGLMETGQSILKVGKAVHSIHDISNYQDVSDLGSKVLTASKDTYCALGGDSTIELGSKIVDCCKKQDFESTKEMVSALGKFVEDDSYVASTERSLIVNTATSMMGSTATSVLGMGVPLLSLAPLAMDGWNLKNTYSNWSDGKATGMELTQSVVTTIGSGLGATVLPFVGPLAASGINKVLSWFG